MPHPSRYPIHEDAEKGQTYGGVCNITHCDNTGAVMWNGMTYGLYCDSCATEINRYSHHGYDICFKVDQYPSAEEMDEMRRCAGGVVQKAERIPSVESCQPVYHIDAYDYVDFDDPLRLSKKQIARNNRKFHVKPKIHVMTRQLRRKLERDAQKGRNVQA